jgi:FkbM family methyltransferase
VKDFFNDVLKCIPSFYPKTVFDVGANVGDFTKSSLDFFPESKYFCFEPSENTYNKLENNIVNNNVFLYKIALSNVNKKLPFTKNYNVCNSLVIEKNSDKENTQLDKLDIRMRALSGDDIETEMVQTKTIDSFCQQNDIEKIDLLKIDTEGFDLEVLYGSKNMLSENNIDIIYTELTFMKDTNKFSKAFEVIEFFMAV